MKRLFSTKAGATFAADMPNLTFVIKKGSVEIIYKLKPGLYLNLSLFRSGPRSVILFANWDKYFKRLSNPDSQITKISKCCPTLYGIIAQEDNNGIVISKCSFPGEEDGEGFMIDIDIADEHLPLIYCIQTVENQILALVTKTLKAYNELYSNPPFPAWKTGLNELWE